MSDAPFKVFRPSIRAARCKDCRKRIYFAMTLAILDPEGRVVQKSRTLPFNGPPTALEVGRTSAGIIFEYWPADALHPKTCPAKPEKRPETARDQRDRTAAYHRRSSADGQRRMF